MGWKQEVVACLSSYRSCISPLVKMNYWMCALGISASDTTLWLFASVRDTERGSEMKSKACRWKIKPLFMKPSLHFHRTFLFFYWLTWKCFMGSLRDRGGIPPLKQNLDSWLIQYITCKSIFGRDGEAAFDQDRCGAAFSFTGMVYHTVQCKSHMSQAKV